MDINNEVLKAISYDKLTGNLTWRKSAPGRRVGRPAGSIKQNGYIQVHVSGKSYQAHHVAWYLTYNYWPIEIDHINGIRTDNRIENLRDVTHSENQKNRGMNKNNKSGYCGINYVESRKKWEVRIQENGKRTRYGMFSDLRDAVKIAEQAYKNLGFYANHGQARKPQNYGGKLEEMNGIQP